MPVLQRLARACALLAGVLLSAVALLTCASILGREIWGVTWVGDFELAGAAAGVAIALLMPICQLRGGNIIVDAFTSACTAGTRAALDRFGALALALLMAVLAWRTGAGAVSAWRNHSSSMLLGLPDWMVYAGMVGPFALTATIGLWQSLLGHASEARA